MQYFTAFVRALLFIAPGASAAGLHGDEHPVVKVISLLDGLKVKAKSEVNAEEVTYAKFAYWCTNSQKELEKAIAQEKDDIDRLVTTVEAKTNEEDVLKKRIAALADELLEAEAAGKGADKERSTAAGVYGSADTDFSATIKAIGEAITALKGAKPAALVQMKLQIVSQLPLVLEQVSVEQAELLANNPDKFKYGTKAQNKGTTNKQTNHTILDDVLAKGELVGHEKKYAFHSDNVIELLKKLQMKFEDDQTQATTEETNAINAHKLSKEARANAVAAAKKAHTEKEALLGDVQKALSTAKADLKNSRDDLKADSKTHETTQQTCQIKASEWEDRVETRANEIKAIEAAIKILSEVSGVRTEPPSNPTLPPSPVNFLQESAVGSDPRARVVSLLRAEARKAHSKAFEIFANQVAARMGGPFDEVTGMIQKMIFRLMAEQNDEDDHKNWCDLELEKTNSSKANKEERIAHFAAKIKSAKARVTEIASEMKDANQMIADVTSHMKEAVEIRSAGRQENEEAVKDAKDAQAALAQAVAVLTEFYKNSGAVPKESYDFLQGPVKLGAEPSTWGSSYTGVADPKNQPDGIVTVLEAVSADFAKMQSETLAQEETDQKEFDDQMKANKIEKARRIKEVEMKEVEKKRVVVKIADHEKSKKHVSDELYAVETYLKDLGPACIDGDSTYDDRKASRSAEIDALKQAQIILADASKGNAAPSAAPSAAFLAPISPVH